MKTSTVTTAIITGVMALTTLEGFSQAQSPDINSPETIRPYKIQIPQTQLNDLRRRIKETRWPDKETIIDGSQGIKLTTLQELVHYWGTGYNWRKAEAKLNALPQYVTNIDGVDIHFIWVRSKNPNALPLIMTHGWPGSIFEFLGTIAPLTDPLQYGGKAEDAFDVVIPSLPGYGFSGKPNTTGWDPDHVGRVWEVLMKRLGYTHYVAQGGDFGARVTQAMARRAPAGLLGIHLNLPAVAPADVTAALYTGAPAPAGLTDQERAVFDALIQYQKKGNAAYFTMMTARPQAVGYGLTDSPAGLAGWILVHPGFAKWNYSADAEKNPAKDKVLDDITLYWLTNSATSAARFYWENKGSSPISAAAQKTSEISLPVAITVFPDDVYRAPESWARRAYPNLIYFHEVDKGGHFAAWEQPQLFAKELRAAFRSVR